MSLPDTGGSSLPAAWRRGFSLGPCASAAGPLRLESQGTTWGGELGSEDS